MTDTVQMVYHGDELLDLNFHDCTVRGLRWDVTMPTLYVDLDFIVEWIRVEERFHFLVAPAELRFAWAKQVAIEFEISWESVQLDSITREDRVDGTSSPVSTWSLNLMEGVVTVETSDARLMLLKPPIRSSSRTLG